VRQLLESGVNPNINLFPDDYPNDISSYLNAAYSLMKYYANLSIVEDEVVIKEAMEEKKQMKIILVCLKNMVQKCL
jgi:hypothetical protein